MAKREREAEDFIALGSEPKSKKQKKDKDGKKEKHKAQQSFAEFKAAAREKKKMKQAIKREKREAPKRRQHPKNLAKYGDLPEQKAARKLAKKEAAEAHAARLANGAVKVEEKPVDEEAAAKKAERKKAKKEAKQARKEAKQARKEITKPREEEVAFVVDLDGDEALTKKVETATSKLAKRAEEAVVEEEIAVADEAEPVVAKKKDKKRKLNGAVSVEGSLNVAAEKDQKNKVDAAAQETQDSAEASKKRIKVNGDAEVHAEETQTVPLKKKKKSKVADSETVPSKKVKKDKDVTNGVVFTKPTVNNLTDASGYTEDTELSALPVADITAFLESKQITINNSGKDRRPITSFKYLPITEEQRVPFKGFSSPTPIQAAAWPYLLDGRDVIGVAETGSGKTLAFGVPCIRRLSTEKSRHIRVCIVSPTRELALQIQEQLAKFTAPFGLKVVCVYGGVDKDAQRREIKGSQIVVATPGRLNDFIGDGSIDLSHVDYMVLDEADRMLDKGFEEEVRKIVSSTANVRQTLMFTATWPPSVRDLAGTFMTNPVRINIGDNTTGELRANTRIVQEVEVMDPMEKQNRLIQLLKQYQSGKDKILVFCLYKKEATRIEEFIRRRGFNVAGIHGDLNQHQRTESLEAFKQGKVPILVATDVAARGLDIPAVKLVINVTFPLTAEDYVHRIGRTGRAGQDGKAITFFTDEEKGLAGALINVLKAANQNVPESLLKYGTTVKKKSHDVYGAFYKDTSDMKAASKITFD